MLIGFLHPLYESDDGDDSTGSESGGKVRASELRATLGITPDEGALMRLLEKHADVLTDNAQLRLQRKALRLEVADLKGKQTPEGARVLTADEAKAYDAYVALGKPADLSAAVAERDTAKGELTKLSRERTIAKAAEAAGFKASVLTTLAGDLDLQVKETEGGKPLAVVVKDGAETALADYAAKHWADFLPSLAPTPARPGGAPDINAGARGNGNGPLLTQQDHDRASDHYRRTF